MAIEYKGGCCIGCGYKRSVAALDFHHLDPAKKDFGLGMNGLTRSWQKTKEELDKCILVCSNCHREVHAGLIILNSKGKVVKKIRASKTKEMLE